MVFILRQCWDTKETTLPEEACFALSRPTYQIFCAQRGAETVLPSWENLLQKIGKVERIVPSLWQTEKTDKPTNRQKDKQTPCYLCISPELPLTEAERCSPPSHLPEASLSFPITSASMLRGYTFFLIYEQPLKTTAGIKRIWKENILFSSYKSDALRSSIQVCYVFERIVVFNTTYALRSHHWSTVFYRLEYIQ